MVHIPLGAGADTSADHKAVINKLAEHDLALTNLENGGIVDQDIYDRFSVLDYGADRTGATDSTSAVRLAIAAAQTNVTNTGRRSVVLFQAGKYLFSTRDGIPIFDIVNSSKLVFLGAPGGRAHLLQQGDSQLANWTMFRLQNSSDIEFRELFMEQNITANPDPGGQNHILQIGAGFQKGCNDIRVYDCEFQGCLGDGIRNIGEFGGKSYNIDIQRNKFTNCSRSGVSVQRWVQNMTLIGNTFRGGADQQLDFEPTGSSFTATAGSGATTIVYNLGHFTTYGLQVNDRVYNGVEQVMARVVSVDSDTQITVTAAAVDWTGDNFYFPEHEGGHIISHNKFYGDPSSQNASGIMVALDEAYGGTFSHNTVHGTLSCTRPIDLKVIGNHFEWRGPAVSQAAILDFRYEIRGLVVSGNTIVTRDNTLTNQPQYGIYLAEQTGDGPFNFTVTNNTIYAETDTTGIYVLGAHRGIIHDNTLTLNTPGRTTQSVAIFVSSDTANTDMISVLGNSIAADQGTWLDGIQMTAVTTNITSCVVGGGTIRGCTNAIRWLESAGGVFTNPPVLVPTINEVGSITPPTSKKFLQLAGVGGSAPFTGSLKPGIYWGTGSPETVLTAGIGSMALRYDGGAGTSLYVKESGTGNTGWVGK